MAERGVVLERVRERLGETASLRLAAAYGGAAIRLPEHERRLQPEHPLCRTLDRSFVSELMKLFGPGAELRIPKAPPKVRRAGGGDLARAMADQIRRRRRRARRGSR